MSRCRRRRSNRFSGPIDGYKKSKILAAALLLKSKYDIGEQKRHSF
jgi:hypothetical protein